MTTTSNKEEVEEDIMIISSDDEDQNAKNKDNVPLKKKPKTDKKKKDDETKNIFEKNCFIGIDLGTTYFAVSEVTKGFEVGIITNPNGDTTTPSCIMFKKDKKTDKIIAVYGKEAFERKGTTKGNCVIVWDWKRLNGRRYIFCGDSFLCNEQCSIIYVDMKRLKRVGNLIGPLRW